MEVEVARTRDNIIVRTATSYLELAKARHALDLLHNESASAQGLLNTCENVQPAASSFPLKSLEVNLRRQESSSKSRK